MIYINDKEKAVELPTMLQSQIASVSTAYGDNILYKSALVKKLSEEYRQQVKQPELDKSVETMQVNGGLSEAAMKADISATENPRSDYADENGNPHWYSAYSVPFSGSHFTLFMT